MLATRCLPTPMIIWPSFFNARRAAKQEFILTSSTPKTIHCCKTQGAAEEVRL